MTKTKDTVRFCLSVDCEATQPALQDIPLGQRAVSAIAELAEVRAWPVTFLVIPTDIEASASLYKDLHQRGHEIGLHLHPAAQGYEEFLGIYDGPTQRTIITEAADRFAQVMGQKPISFCPGYYSANDHTYSVLAELGFEHGACSGPGRVLPECASVWAGAPCFVHYAHRHNRLLPGDLDFVEIPRTADPQSMMWGGKTPQDLRIELVDSKNHFYTIQKSLKQQIDDAQPIKLIHAFTHNIFDYDKAENFRRKTLQEVMAHFDRLAEQANLCTAGATLAQIAAEYRKTVTPAPTTLKLDRRGHRENN